jgi:hypothetical protein
MRKQFKPGPSTDLTFRSAYRGLRKRVSRDLDHFGFGRLAITGSK